MDFHRPPYRAARARRSVGSGWPIGLAIAIGFTVAGCSSADDDAASDLPSELVAADDATTGSSDEGAASDEGDAVMVEGVEPIEDAETVPAEPLDTEAVDLTSDTPARVIEEVSDQVAAVDEGDELLDSVGQVDRADEPPAEPDGRARNGYGELVELDAEASLACANIEIAIGQLDEGQRAAAEGYVQTGATQAEASGIADIRSWADPLRVAADQDIDDPAALVGFLSVCTEGGYEL